MKKGFFITMEGTEGSGKSTQARFLCASLRKKGLQVVHTREPGGARLAEGIRRLLLDPANSMSSLTELFLYEAARIFFADGRPAFPPAKAAMEESPGPKQ